MERIENILVQHPFFSGMDAQYFDMLYDLTVHRHFDINEQIFDVGAEADSFFLIHSGRVALYTSFIAGRGRITIQTVGPKEALGWSWLFPPHTWHFGARALEPTDAAALDAKALRNYARQNHHFGYELAMRVGGVLFQRLQATRLQLVKSLDEPAANSNHVFK